MTRFWLFGLLFIAGAAQADELRVVASVKPLHSLVAGVMAGAGEPNLLLASDASPHTFSLKPSQVSMLHDADVIFYIGEHFELPLKRVFAGLPKSTQRIDMSKTPGLALLPVRPRGVWSEIDHDHGDGPDLHYWLAPKNAVLMVRHIETTLSARDPAHRDLYHRNAQALEKRLSELDTTIRARTETLRTVPFVVFHDATQYFEKAYELTALAAITMPQEHQVAAQHVSEINALLRAQKVSCVFSEPAFDSKIIAAITAGTHAKSAPLDPEATRLKPGKELYFQILTDMAASAQACLSQ